ncbi:amphi-Trp domain-containing protein [Micromonospora sp. NPDC049559]|uniref:amphi-Trp domain-containing protein n=1 Tax=Micromonospora sp. NPDC049559 TaxID=3155923 RepID=UPI003436A029
MSIYEDSRTVSRTDLAAWLRQLANQLESGGQLFYGAAGAVKVADQVRCELEIEREGDTELSVEIEFSWDAPEPAESAEDEPAEEESDEEEESEEETAAAEETAGDSAAEAVKA